MREHLASKQFLIPDSRYRLFSDKELKKAIIQADILVGNDYEIKMIQKRTGWSEADILKKTVKCWLRLWARKVRL